MNLLQEMELLNNLVIQQSQFVENHLDQATQTFLHFDEEKIQEVILADETINALEVEIEELCLSILAKYQPVAKDLRFIVSVLKINNDLERVGDLSVKIVKRLRHFSKDDYNTFLLPEMVEKVKVSLSSCIQAFCDVDKKLALQVCSMDEEIDELKSKMKLKMIKKSKEEPDQADKYINLLINARHLERIADLATNIAEDVVFYCEGTIIRHQV